MGNFDQTDILGYNITSKRFVFIASDDQMQETMPFLSEGRVLYYQTPIRNGSFNWAGSKLVLWDWATNESRVVAADIGNNVEASAFWRDWIVIRTKHNTDPSTDGIWAVHLVTGEKVQLARVYRPASGIWLLASEAVHNDVAYYAVWEQSADRTWSQNTIWSVALGNNSRNMLYQGHHGYAASHLQASDFYLTWERNDQSSLTRLYALNLETGTARHVTDFEEELLGFSDLGGKFVTFSSGDRDRGLRVLNLETGSNVMLIRNDNIHGGQDSSTDGQYYVIALRRLSQPPYASHGSDVYLGTLR